MRARGAKHAGVVATNIRNNPLAIVENRSKSGSSGKDRAGRGEESGREAGDNKVGYFLYFRLR
jgi:hypothetical protein